MWLPALLWIAQNILFFSGGLPRASTPTASPSSGAPPQTVTLTAATGPVICFNTSGSPATNGTTGCTTGTLYTTTISVSTSETLYFVAGGTGYLDSSIGTATYSAAIPTITQSCSYFVSGSGNNSNTCTFGSAITAGHRLWGCVNNDSSTSLSGATIAGDSDTFVPDPGAGTAITNITWNSSAEYTSCWYVASTTGGGSTITITHTSNIDYNNIAFVEIAGSANGIDQSDNGVASASSNSPASGTVTTGYANELVLGVLVMAGSSAITVGSGFVSLQNTGSSNGASLECYGSAGSCTGIASSGTMTSATWNTTNNKPSFAHVITFRP